MKTNFTTKAITGTFLVAILLVAFTLFVPVTFADPVPQDITVADAYGMINGGAFPDLTVLDVRNQSEYGVNHLYDAVLIPLHELEARIGELAGSMNDEIIVYCGLGGRSEIAADILVGGGFTKVYNMLGGITAWVEADYPIYTTYHNVKVNITGNKGVHLEIEPLLVQMGCTSCAQNGTCPSDGESANITSTVLEENETTTVVLITVEVNGTVFEQTLTRTMLWDYSDNTSIANKTASFTLTEITNGPIMTQFYTLTYIVEHLDYAFAVSTNLTPLDAETYNSSYTIVNYVPTGESEVKTWEVVEFDSPLTLSQLYSALNKVAKKIGQFYKHEGIKTSDPALMQIAQNYNEMAKETKNLYSLVKNNLQDYDKLILDNSAVLSDQDILGCLAAILSCLISIATMPEILATCYLCVQVITCIAPCLTVFGIPWCLICIGTGILGCLTCAYLVAGFPYECYTAGQCLGLW